MSRLKFLAKMIFKTGVVAAAAPTIGLGTGMVLNSALLDNFEALKHPPVDKIAEKFELEKIVQKYGVLGVNDYGVVDFLNLSYLAVITHLKYKLNDITSNDLEIEYALDNGVGVCDEFAYFTSTIYHYLAEKAGKTDLSKKIRISYGIAETDEGEYAHSWVEYLSEGEWVAYETTRMPYLGSSFIDLLGTAIKTKESLSLFMNRKSSETVEYTDVMNIYYLNNHYDSSVALNVLNPLVAYAIAKLTLEELL